MTKEPSTSAPGRSRRRRWRLLTLGLPVALLTLCLAGSATPPAVETAPARTSDVVNPLPRISAPPQVGEERGQLVNTHTGQPFRPRGANYVRLAPLQHRNAWFHSTFEPGLYDAPRAEAALSQMQLLGYNVVRVFIDPGDDRDSASGEPHGLGHGSGDLSTGQASYYDNVADFVRRAARHRIYVLPAIDFYPRNAYYRSIVDAAPPTNAAGYNAMYLHRGRVDAKRTYARHFVEEMRHRLGAPLLTTFLAIQLDNEATFDAAQAPFDRWTGTVVGPDGVAYDMADRAQRQQAADASMVVYANESVRAVRQVDPKMMVTMGLFTYRAVGKTVDGFARSCSGTCPGDHRYPGRPASLSHFSTLSFLDVHVYAGGNGWTLEADLASSEWSRVRGPVVMGELGTERMTWNHDAAAAALGLRDLQVSSCGQGFSGWVYWTWDTEETATQRRFFSLTSGQEEINRVLAPITRPDPCSPLSAPRAWPRTRPPTLPSG